MPAGGWGECCAGPPPRCGGGGGGSPPPPHQDRRTLPPPARRDVDERGGREPRQTAFCVCSVTSEWIGVQDAVSVGDAPVHQARERLARDRNPLLHDVRLGQRCTHRTLPRRVVHFPAEHNALPPLLIIRLE